MHRCLLVAELAQRIAEACAPEYKSLSPEEGPSPGLKTVYALAQTCRVLQEPAMSVLWYCQFGVYRLIKCMPDNAWEIYNEDRFDQGMLNWYRRHTGRRIRFTRELDSTDWERFDFYARHVRKFEYRQGYTGSFDRKYAEPAEETFSILGLRGVPLLPLLQDLKWMSYPWDESVYRYSIRFLRCHLSSTLTSICLMPGLCSSVDFGDALSLLPSESPQLQKVEIHLQLRLFDVQHLSNILQQLGHLQRTALSIRTYGNLPYVVPGHDVQVRHHEASYPNSQLCLQLTTVPQLREFSILNNLVYLSDLTLSPHSIKFASLDKLKLSFSDAKYANTLFHEASFPAAKSLDLSYLRSEPSHIQQLLALIRSSFSYETLESLVLTTPQVMELHLARTDSVLSASLYDPLHDFHNLREVQFDIRSGLRINDADLEAFGRAWPRLVSIAITSNSVAEMVAEMGALATQPVEKPTYRGLASLVRQCPDLKKIRIVIAEEVHSVREFLDSEDMVVSSNEVQLDLMHTPADDLDTLALWIAKMFPRCSGISCMGMSPPSYYAATEPLVMNGTLQYYPPWQELMELVDRYKNT